MTGIGERINARRKELGMTQEELSKKLGYKNKSTISQIENGVNDIMQSKVASFAEALNTTVAYLVGLEEPTQPKKNASETSLNDADMSLCPQKRRLRE